MAVDVYDVAIIGAGPAGSSLAIELSDRGHRVLLLEKEAMPRDKLCGEFLSTEVGAICSRLGILERMRAAGAKPITQAVCTTPRTAGLVVELPGTALGMSRRAFDLLLFERAREVGVEASDVTAVRSIQGSLEGGFRVDTDSGRRISSRLVVGAYGRRDALDRKLDRPSLHSRSPFVAFKAHFDGYIPGGLIEVHTFSGGYCGLLVEEEGLVNVCWIVHRDRLQEAGGSPEALLERMRTWSDHLAERLEHLDPRGPYLAVSQLEFRRKELFAKDVCLIGDAAGMIAPLCGDGMGMAMQSSQIAAPIIDGFLRGRISSASLRKIYRREWIGSFRRRMVIGRLLHALFVRPAVLAPGLLLARSIPKLASGIVSATRG